MDEIINERGHNVPGCTNKSILWGRIIQVKGEEKMKNGKTLKIEGFYATKKWKKSSNGPPFGSFSKGNIKIAHLLPERSAHRDDHFLQTWPLLSGALD